MRNVEWAAGLDDRSENTDYSYKKKRLWKSTGGYFTWASVLIRLILKTHVQKSKMLSMKIRIAQTPYKGNM